MILVMNVAFYYLKINKVNLDVRINNEHAKSFYNRFGYTKVSENDIEFIYIIFRNFGISKVSENDIDEFYELNKEEYDKLYEEKYKSLIKRR